MLLYRGADPTWVRIEDALTPLAEQVYDWGLYGQAMDGDSYHPSCNLR